MAFVIITVLTQVFWFHSVVWLSHQHVLYRHASGIGSGVQHWRALNRGPGCRIRFGCTHSPLPPGGVFAVDLCGNLKKKSWLLNVATHPVPLPGRLGSGWEKFLFRKNYSGRLALYQALCTVVEVIVNSYLFFLLWPAALRTLLRNLFTNRLSSVVHLYWKKDFIWK